MARPIRYCHILYTMHLTTVLITVPPTKYVLVVIYLSHVAVILTVQRKPTILSLFTLLLFCFSNDLSCAVGSSFMDALTMVITMF